MLLLVAVVRLHSGTDWATTLDILESWCRIAGLQCRESHGTISQFALITWFIVHAQVTRCPTTPSNAKNRTTRTSNKTGWTAIWELHASSITLQGENNQECCDYSWPFHRRRFEQSSCGPLSISTDGCWTSTRFVANCPSILGLE